MEEQLIPIVNAGKYKGKPVTELLVDNSYIDFLKNQNWFNPNNKLWSPVYNIVVNQSITTNKDNKTPEHNRLQNKFLEKNNQEKLLSIIFKNKHRTEKIKKLLKDDEFIRLFGINSFEGFKNDTNDIIIRFEAEFNWDIKMVHLPDGRKYVKFTTIPEVELFDRQSYREKYDEEQKIIYENNLILFDELINIRKKIDQDENDKYERQLEEYKVEFEKYQHDLIIYLQQKSQNEKDIEEYNIQLKKYKCEYDSFRNKKTKQICMNLRINYNDFQNWNTSKDDNRYSDLEKKQLISCVNDNLNPLLEDYENNNKKPNVVKKINIPHEPKKICKPRPEYSISYMKFCDYDGLVELMERSKKNLNISELHRVGNETDNYYSLYGYKNKYINEYNKNYENKFNKDYETYRIRYYRDLISKYTNNIEIYKKDDVYVLKIYTSNGNMKIYSEIKPLLGDDYPCVLRKLNTQIELTKTDNQKKYDETPITYTLIVQDFNSNCISKEQLKEIFNQSNIKVIFTDDLFGIENNLENLLETQIKDQKYSHEKNSNEIINDLSQLNKQYLNEELKEENEKLKEENEELKEENEKLKEELEKLKEELEKIANNLTMQYIAKEQINQNVETKLNNLKVSELKEKCKELTIKNYNKMNKKQLIEALIEVSN